MSIAALIVAAGRGRRFGGATPKQYRELGGETVLRRTLRTFVNHKRVNIVQAVIHPDDRAAFDAAAAGFDLPAPVAGGDSRQQSVLNGLEALATASPDCVLIHDGARPFVGDELIDRVLVALAAHAGAVPALPVSDTLKRAAGGLVETTVERDGLWRVQTPQGFRFAKILAAHRTAAGRELTDDAAVAEYAGLDVAVVEGSERNVKITRSEDLDMTVGNGLMWEHRTGQGFDVHRFEPGDAVQLCGVAVPHDAKLAGHSDADVGLHALTDAILGAVGAGDIGHHFPPSDPRWRGAASSIFLEHAASLVADAGGGIVNVDVTLICERPKVGPHREAMRAAIADLLAIDVARVSVKATTTERLGFTGRCEGIAAQALATVRLPAEK
ncbi:MAG: bifunctional 2-C-methyl-D-erythritol 4-phosphate cytidylyltransferase/2-C-methyl-D-erythritol 2,4-cyclodiphosphate synthase [Rhodospirillaceae bacterium]